LIAMRTDEFQLGMRVRRRGSDGSFCKDRRSALLKGRRIGVVVGLPESVTPRHKAVLVQWENTFSLPDEVFIHRLEALPKAQQPVALGGKWQRPDAAA
jgi:hypothetical protein